MEDAAEAADAAAMSIYDDQWTTVKSELPLSAVEEVKGDDDEILQDEDKATESGLWKAVQLELPWDAVEEEEEKMKDEERKEEMMNGDDSDDDYDDDEMVHDEDEIAKILMRSFRRGWEHCFGSTYGSFEDNSELFPQYLSLQAA